MGITIEQAQLLVETLVGEIMYVGRQDDFIGAYGEKQGKEEQDSYDEVVENIMIKIRRDLV